MGKFAVPIRLKGGKGLEKSQAEAGAIIYRKPILTFEYNNEGDVLEFAFQVDPSKLTARHNNRIAAAQSRLSAAQRFTEKLLEAQTNAGGGSRKPITREELPDAALLVEVLVEVDDALDERLIDTVMRDENGQTMWNVVDEFGGSVQLTKEWLEQNVKMAEAIHAAWGEWYSPTKRSSEEVSKTSTENGTTVSTQATQKASSGDSPTQYVAPTARDKTITDAALSLAGSSNSA